VSGAAFADDNCAASGLHSADSQIKSESLLPRVEFLVGRIASVYLLC